MATDARDERESMRGVERAAVYLRDHMHEAVLNEGVNARQSFEESFPDADGEVDSVRATLDDKARLSRQHAAVEELLDAGVSARPLARYFGKLERSLSFRTTMTRSSGPQRAIRSIPRGSNSSTDAADWHGRT